MKRFSIIILSVLCLGVICAEAKGKKKANKKAEVAVVDTVPTKVFSYAYGMANTQGLKGFLAMRKGVDTAQYMDAFMRGFNSGADDDRFIAALRAYLAGVEIRQQAQNEICKRIDEQLLGTDSLSLIDREAFLNGFRDGIAGTTVIPMDSAIHAVDKNSTYYSERLMEEKYGDWRRQNVDYLAANSKKDSVVTLPSGLQYKVLVMGEGAKPAATDKVTVNYEGTLIEGTVFDSSYKRKQPATFPCNRVIKGWTEALQLMPVGSKWVLYIPQELAYGTREQGKIKPFSALTFTVELLSIEK